MSKEIMKAVIFTLLPMYLFGCAPALKPVSQMVDGEVFQELNLYMLACKGCFPYREGMERNSPPSFYRELCRRCDMLHKTARGWELRRRYVMACNDIPAERKEEAAHAQPWEGMTKWQVENSLGYCYGSTMVQRNGVTGESCNITPNLSLYFVNDRVSSIVKTSH